MDPKEHEAGDPLYFSPVDVNGRVDGCLCFPEVDDEFFGLGGVERKVVICAPCCQVLDFLPVG